MTGEPVPIACTLSRDALPGRIDAWQLLLSQAMARSAESDGILLTFARDVSFSEIAALVIAEHACCPFLTFTLVANREDITLQVIAPPEAAPLVTELFGARG